MQLKGLCAIKRSIPPTGLFESYNCWSQSTNNHIDPRLPLSKSMGLDQAFPDRPKDDQKVTESSHVGGLQNGA